MGGAHMESNASTISLLTLSATACKLNKSCSTFFSGIIRHCTLSHIKKDSHWEAELPVLFSEESQHTLKETMGFPYTVPWMPFISAPICCWWLIWKLFVVSKHLSCFKCIFLHLHVFFYTSLISCPLPLSFSEAVHLLPSSLSAVLLLLCTLLSTNLVWYNTHISVMSWA